MMSLKYDQRQERNVKAQQGLLQHTLIYQIMYPVNHISVMGIEVKNDPFTHVITVQVWRKYVCSSLTEFAGICQSLTTILIFPGTHKVFNLKYSFVP